ncbi:MAG: SGNH/GDSL hydrolase family protein [Magnetospirillum sp.]|nr:SGNH/GDSL hydrolase family protein [Magnetospirillum sp.]
MTKPAPALRHPRLVAAAVLLAVTLLLLGVVEAGLRLLAPTAVVSIGWGDSVNGRRYGWGFDPHEMIMVRDPDSGRFSLERVNGAGWRDRERVVAKRDGAFRVLVLGDSNAFGYAVAGEDMFGRQLEDSLKADGLDAEVITLAHSGWGTDQEVEALQRDGLVFRPDVVVIHYCGNDLTDNVMWTMGGKFARRRPFIYALDEQGRAVRRPNPAHAAAPLGTRVQEFFLRRVELAKRLHTGWKTMLALRLGRYALSPGQVDFMALNLGPGHEAFLAEMRGLIGTSALDEATLTAAIDRHGLADARAALLRIAERVNVQEGLVQGTWEGAFEASDDRWQLLFALFREAKILAASGGAPLVLSTDFDDGRWQWERSWHHVPDDAATKARYLSTNDRLRAFAAAEGIAFAEPVHPVTRARNDAHPNAAGNRAIAANIRLALDRAGYLPRQAQTSK